VLELGCAAGGYTLPLARRGHRITAVDISEVELQSCRRRLAEAGLSEQVRCIQADARDLTVLGGAMFDAVLIMGPLYHLVLECDRLLALRQALCRLRPGGVILSAFISRYGIMGDLLRNVPRWIEEHDEVRHILDLGRDPEHYGGAFRGYFATVEEIAPLHESLGFETLLVAGVEPAISADDESYNVLQGDQRRLWLDLLEEICAEPSIVGASRHLLYVGRKPGARSPNPAQSR